MKRNLLAIFVSIIVMAIVVCLPANARGDNATQKTFLVRWKAVEGIIRYTVQIRNPEGSLVLDSSVETNQIKFTLSPGTYQIRVGAINKFEKMSFWTDWKNIDIKIAGREDFFKNEFPAKTGLAIRVGLSYHMILPPWSRKYNDTDFTLQRLAYVGSLGFHFGNSKYLNLNNFVRFMGVEIEGSYCDFDDHFNPTFQSSLKNITGGPNLFLKTQLESVVNFYLRVGGGVNYSRQNYAKINLYGSPYQPGSIQSIDPYVKAGVSMELNFFYALSLSFGVDYFVTFYQDQYFQQIHFSAMIGARI
ncbi:MAG: hypothetical protein E4G96_01945 [Chrysiogenales bacterium]|nr:MAG: hypothetical protein E4G96_01945 [Chrysiogenales bacterium]